MLLLGLQLQRLRSLRLVRVLRACIDLELRQLRTREPVARQHALHRLAKDLRRPALELLAQCAAAQAARVARVAVVALLVELLAGDGDLLRVDHDDEVAGVDVRRVLRLVLAAEGVGDARRQPSEGLPLGVDDVPVARDLTRLCVPRLHEKRGQTRRPPARDGSNYADSATARGTRPPISTARIGSSAIAAIPA